MSSAVTGLDQFVGVHGSAILATIADGEMKTRVVSGLAVCRDTLAVVDALDLTRYELTDLGAPDLSVWEAAAPQVRDVILAVHTALEGLERVFPSAAPLPGAKTGPTELDLDRAFAELGEAPPARDNQVVQIDALVEQASAQPGQDVGGTIATLANMLRTDFDSFGARLRSPKVITDRWYLLGELQEFRSKCVKCLEAIALSLLGVFAAEPSIGLLPRYRSEASRAAELRAALVDLSVGLENRQRALATGQASAVPKVFAGLQSQMAAFSNTPAYRSLRAQDKREVILFLLWLRNPEQNPPTRAELHQRLEGFAKFLETMRGINRREELRVWDRHRMAAAAQLLEADSDQAGACAQLALVYGRDAELDAWLRAERAGVNPPTTDLVAILARCQAELATRG